MRTLPPLPTPSQGACYLCPSPSVAGSHALEGATVDRNVGEHRATVWLLFCFREGELICCGCGVGDGMVGKHVCVCQCVCVCTRVRAATTPLPASALGLAQAHGPWVCVRTLGGSQEC